ncbi:MAG: ElyC/SanA/YdcF family protein [Patescibacteria group bacterium]
MRWPVYIFGIFVALVIFVNVAVRVVSKSYIYNDINDVPKAEVIIIPGAGVFPNGALSAIFLERVDKAVELYEANKASKILVSGDNSSDAYNEVNPVRLYLISKGIPEANIFLDHAGFDTYSTMYRARDIFGVSSIIISTQSFHLPRAVFLARQLGIEASGASADIGSTSFRNYWREILANEKAVINLIFKRKPQYLGDKIKI